MNKIIDEILSTRKTIGTDGTQIDIHSEISRAEGQFIFDYIAQDTTILKTLEVGCAYGLSSLHICEALKTRENAHHTILDPFQNTDWNGAGVHALTRAGLNNFTLVEECSEFALPQILKEHGDESFDFIFIDGWHTFDHTLVDCFYANRLLRKGGILIVDDCDFAPVAKAVKYINSYPCYHKKGCLIDYPDSPILNSICRIGNLIPLGHDLRYRLPKRLRQVIRRPNMVALKKEAQDKRPWNWYKPF